MRSLKFLGTTAAVALMIGALAPGTVSAEVSSDSRTTVTDARLTDGDGNKLSSEFFSAFNFTTDASTTATLGTVGTDGDGAVFSVNKAQFEDPGFGDFLTQSFSADQSDPPSFATSEATLSGALVDRGGDAPQAFPNADVNTQGRTELNEPNSGGTATEVFTQVFNFIVNDGIENESVELRLNADSALATTEIAPLFATGIGADSALTVTLRLGPPGDRVNVNLRDLVTDDEVGFGQALPGFDLELDNVNETEGNTRAFRLIPIDAGGNPILFSAGDQGSITFRQEANTTAVASIEDIPPPPPPPVPVPATMMLLGTGLLGLGLVSMNRARRRKDLA